MIQAIKTEVMVGGDSKELSIDYDEYENYVTMYLDNKYLFGMNYNDNFKEVIKKIQERW